MEWAMSRNSVSVVATGNADDHATRFTKAEFSLLANLGNEFDFTIALSADEATACDCATLTKDPSKAGSLTYRLLKTATGCSVGDGVRNFSFPTVRDASITIGSTLALEAEALDYERAQAKAMQADRMATASRRRRAFAVVSQAPVNPTRQGSQAAMVPGSNPATSRVTAA
jgi:hypothetical protein